MESIVEWQSPEHNFDRKTPDWYWALGVIAVGSAVLAFYFHNWIFGIFITLAAFVIGILSYRDTRVVTIKISERGITFGEKLHPFKEYRSFWIEEDHVHGPRILLRTFSSFMPLSIIPVAEEIDLNELHQLLIHFLREEYLSETLIHKLFDKMLAK
jgi:hypothetical protein